MLKYILFDLDGTLIDTNELIILALKESTKKYLSKELSTEDLHSILGKHLEDQIKYLSPLHYNDMILCYKEFYKSNQDKMVKEFPGVQEMLREIKAIGCKTAIVSAKGRGGIEHGLKLFKLDQYVDAIVSAYDVQNNKPHPESANKAIELLEANKNETVIVGDSPYDILCGKNAGIKTALVDWTIFPKNELHKLNPDYIIKSPSDLTQIIRISSTSHK